MERILNQVAIPNVFVNYSIGLSNVHLISNEAMEYKTNVIDNILHYCYSYTLNPNTQVGSIVFNRILQELTSNNINSNESLSSSLIGFILEEITFSLLNNQLPNQGIISSICNKSVPYFYVNVFNRNEYNTNLLESSNNFINTRQNIRKSIKDIFNKNTETKIESTIKVVTFAYNSPLAKQPDQQPKSSSNVLTASSFKKEPKMITEVTVSPTEKVEISQPAVEEKLPLEVHTARWQVEEDIINITNLYKCCQNNKLHDSDHVINRILVAKVETLCISDDNKESLEFLNKLFKTKLNEYSTVEHGIKLPTVLFKNNLTKPEFAYIIKHISAKLTDEINKVLMTFNLEVINNLIGPGFNFMCSNLENAENKSLIVDKLNETISWFFSSSLNTVNGSDLYKFADDRVTEKDENDVRIYTLHHFYCINEDINTVSEKYNEIGSLARFGRYQKDPIVELTNKDYINCIREQEDIKLSKNYLLTKDGNLIELVFVNDKTYAIRL